MLLEIGARTFKAMRAHGTFSVRILPLSKVRACHCHARFILVYAYTFARLCVYFQKLFSGDRAFNLQGSGLQTAGGLPKINTWALRHKYVFSARNTNFYATHFSYRLKKKKNVAVQTMVQTEGLNIFWAPEMEQSDWLESGIADLDSIITCAF